MTALVAYLIAGLFWTAVATTAGFVLYAAVSLLRLRRRAHTERDQALHAASLQRAKDRAIEVQRERGITANAERLVAETEAYLWRAWNEEETS